MFDFKSSARRFWLEARDTFEGVTLAALLMTDFSGSLLLCKGGLAPVAATGGLEATYLGGSGMGLGVGF